jgi:GTP-binding protein
MDSNDLERERGITILSKNTAVTYKDTLINIVDTPGHADFGGEVERVLGMVDGCILIVDANEGPMPQTRFVLKKALEKGLRPIVVLNKIDRPQADPHGATNKVLDLFLELGADDDQCEFPYLYATGLGGWAKKDLDDEGKDMQPLFEAILDHVPPPVGDIEKPLQLQVTTLDYSEYLGRIVIGKVHNGVITAGQQAALVTRDGQIVKSKISKLLGFQGLQRIEIESASAGQIVAVAGFADANIGETVACPDNPDALPLISVDEPTLGMTFAVNDSPFAGQEGKFVTSRQIRDRLMRELETNVALRVEETDSPDRFPCRAGGTAPGHLDRNHATGRLRVPSVPASGDLSGGERPALRTLRAPGARRAGRCCGRLHGTPRSTTRGNARYAGHRQRPLHPRVCGACPGIDRLPGRVYAHHPR